jgi:hypothetical protein
MELTDEQISELYWQYQDMMAIDDLASAKDNAHRNIRQAYMARLKIKELEEAIKELERKLKDYEFDGTDY